MASRAKLAPDQRASERYPMRLAGKLFVPAEEVTLDCTIINLSVGGAGIYCAEPPPLDCFVVLYIDGFGRYEGVTTRYVEGELGRIAARDIILYYEEQRYEMLGILPGLVEKRMNEQNPRGQDE